MPQRLILLTGSFDAEALVHRFEQANPFCQVLWVTTGETLAAAFEEVRGLSARLVSFCTGVIVPKHLLDGVGGPAYNIHPGPPNFPGRYPECWGAYFGARRFGATMHVMAPRVDEGMIVDTRWVEMPSDVGQRIYGREGFRAAIQLLGDWIVPLATLDRPFPGNGEQWSGRKWRLADIEELSHIPADVTAAEFERRRRAFAEVPGQTLTTELHGRVFTYTAPEAPI